MISVKIQLSNRNQSQPRIELKFHQSNSGGYANSGYPNSIAACSSSKIRLYSVASTYENFRIGNIVEHSCGRLVNPLFKIDLTRLISILDWW